jgi:hypothetical protein
MRHFARLAGRNAETRDVKPVFSSETGCPVHKGIGMSS